jgi:hypothetical protein
MRQFLSVAFFFLLSQSASAQQSASARGYGDIPERFFGFVAQGKTNEAIDYVYGTNQWAAKNSDQVANLKGELARLNNLVGKYAFHELLVEERAGSRYVHLVYLVGYDRQPLRIELSLYRPYNEWRFQGVSVDAKVVEDVAKSANRRISK